MTSYLLIGAALVMGQAQADPAPSVRVVTTAVPNAYGDPSGATAPAMLPASAPALPPVPPNNSAAAAPAILQGVRVIQDTPLTTMPQYTAPPIYPFPTSQAQSSPEQKNAGSPVEKKEGDAATDKKSGDSTPENKTGDAADQHNPDNWTRNIFTPRRDSGGFAWRFYKAYYDEFFPKKDKENAEEEAPPAPRRALPAPFAAPPFPSAEYQGYPLIGVPPDSSVYPLMKAIYGGPCGEEIKESRIKAYGWVNASGNWSTARNSNLPDSYWIVPNRYELDQLVLRIERQVDSVQTDHIDWGFRSTLLYGIDYRFMTAGGWFSDQLLKHNFLYGADPTEQYFDLYVPWITQGMILRVGRWIACPDIETQFAPDNYMGTHSILFTFDTYTQTGVMATFMLNKQWTVQACINAGDDMAPWYKGAIPCGMFGVRWVSCDNNDSIYAVLNQINNAEFRHFEQFGQPLGHDNFNYPVVTWQHKFDEQIHTKTEGYFMWQRNAELGGTPSAGPLKPFGGGGGDGMLLPGTSLAYGVVNYTMFGLSKQSFLTFRNEWWKDERGMRSGFPGTYTSHAIGLSYNVNSFLQVRPEIGYYRNWTNPAFDLGTKNGIWLYGFDMTLRF